ncbi:Uncharacterized conserved protein, contains Zn-finger domain [Ectothiorhodosinus mongolicus]|uniref:Uncharacterized conserved protein, contains Zn-finger domain n=1 Tax=Ectothiorhodosinus mongolicus TaxID=233100 RepID=A0A1R3VU87_9GAMM|nr:zinc-finger domain-containing protein [Ectothiorhodosinus mongolicus]SIT68480.1 Uncharacterized conserved protein, contains Zn-finger domain [Ectothiorhodosinus mongolicus]
MPSPNTGKDPMAHAVANQAPKIKVTKQDLPLHCPMPGTALWASHPRVYLPIEDTPDGKIICPYCSTEFTL